MARSQILVIDDEPLMGDYVQETLVRAGHDVDVCTSGAAGLELMQKNSYDVLITDLRMEPMDGIQVLQRARKESPGTGCLHLPSQGELFRQFLPVVHPSGFGRPERYQRGIQKRHSDRHNSTEAGSQTEDNQGPCLKRQRDGAFTHRQCLTMLHSNLTYRLYQKQ